MFGLKVINLSIHFFSGTRFCFVASFYSAKCLQKYLKDSIVMVSARVYFICRKDGPSFWASAFSKYTLCNDVMSLTFFFMCSAFQGSFPQSISALRHSAYDVPNNFDLIQFSFPILSFTKLFKSIGSSISFHSLNMTLFKPHRLVLLLSHSIHR